MFTGQGTSEKPVNLSPRACVCLIIIKIHWYTDILLIYCLSLLQYTPIKT
jgi:hypothetical protein